ncbi:MAG: alpha/beta hydrolase [Candidatus Woesearchaeota archaeon]
MKRFIIIHGWDGNSEEPMLKWFKEKIKKKGFNVSVPEMPNSAEPKIEEWVQKIKEVVQEPNSETNFIGHSVGCQGILRYLESINPKFKVGRLILIAPWMYLNEKTIEEEGEEVKEIARPWMETPIDWNKIKEHLEEKPICIFSDNDPYVPLSNENLFKEKIGAEVVIEHNKGHFTVSDGVEKLPIILKYI